MGKVKVSRKRKQKTAQTQAERLGLMNRDGGDKTM